MRGGKGFFAFAAGIMLFALAACQTNIALPSPSLAPEDTSCATPCTWDGRGGLRLIKRLSTIITVAKEWAFPHLATRYGRYLLAAMGLLLFWLCFLEGEIAFVYSAFYFFAVVYKVLNVFSKS